MPSVFLYISTIFIVLIIAVSVDDVLPIFLMNPTTNNCCNSRITEPISVDAQPAINKAQTWVDQQNNVKIQFVSQPDNPVVNKPAELRFRVQDLRTGEDLKNLSARVAVTDGQRVFKFADIAVPNGNFLVNYLFPESGTYQVIGRVDGLDENSNNNFRFSTLSSFQVFVPVTISSNTSTIITIVTAIIFGVIVFWLIRFVLNRRKKEREYDLH